MKLFEVDTRPVEQRMAEKIVANCYPFLQELNTNDFSDKLLYRGTYARYLLDEPIVKRTMHESPRAPRSTSYAAHVIMNMFFERKFGYPWRDALFTTFDYASAKTYGEPWAIFPIGEFEYLFSPQIHDMYATLMVWVENYCSEDKELNDSEQIDSCIEDMLQGNTELATLLIRKLNDVEWNHNTGLALQATKHTSEIMLKCRTYYMIIPPVVSNNKRFVRYLNYEFARYNDENE